MGRPLRKLVAGARSIGAGDLEHTIELRDRTELSVLAKALNLSTARLAEMVRRVERQRDEFETLYRFTDQLSRAVRPGMLYSIRGRSLASAIAVKCLSRPACGGFE